MGRFRFSLALLVFALAGCASQSDLSQYPDLRVDPEATPTVLTPAERQQAIEELQNAAEGNSGG